jgi:hypothetical protein
VFEIKKNQRLIRSEGRAVTYRVWMCMSYERLNGIVWWSELRAWSHDFKKRNDSAAGIFAPSSRPCYDPQFCTTTGCTQAARAHRFRKNAIGLHSTTSIRATRMSRSVCLSERLSIHSLCWYERWDLSTRYVEYATGIPLS